MKSYFQEVWLELKKVDWPGRQQTLRQTGLVIAASLVIAIYLGGLDYIFTQLLELLVR